MALGPGEKVGLLLVKLTIDVGVVGLGEVGVGVVLLPIVGGVFWPSGSHSL